MEKPKSVIYGIRLLYVSAVLVTVALLFLYASSGSSVADLFFIVILPVSILFYFVSLLSKGRFWVRSVFLALTVIGIGKLLLGFGPSSAGELLIFLILSAAQIRALLYLYTKEANVWYAHFLMEENLKKQHRNFK